MTRKFYSIFIRTFLLIVAQCSPIVKLGLDPDPDASKGLAPDLMHMDPSPVKKKTPPQALAEG
jgi:hypothetical protein